MTNALRSRDGKVASGGGLHILHNADRILTHLPCLQLADLQLLDARAGLDCAGRFGWFLRFSPAFLLAVHLLCACADALLRNSVHRS